MFRKNLLSGGSALLLTAWALAGPAAAGTVQAQARATVQEVYDSNVFSEEELEGSDYEDCGAHNLAVDAAGNAYVASFTASSDFPTTPGAYQPVFSGQTDVFVTKLSPTGQVIYSTYLGGSEEEYVRDMVVNNTGAYVTGRTPSTDYPTTAGVFQEQHRGGLCGSGYTLHPCG